MLKNKKQSKGIRRALATGLLLAMCAQEAFAAGLTLQSGATMTLTGAPTMSLTGDYINNGTFNSGTSTVVLNGSASSVLESGGSFLYNLSVSKTGAADADDNVTVQTDALTVTGTTTVSDGEFVQSANMTLDDVLVGASGKYTNIGTADLTLSGDVSNAGTILFDANGLGGGDSDSIAITSSAAVGRNWQGAGVFSMTDVDVNYQTAIGGTPTHINVLNGTDTGGVNNVNWFFGSGALSNVAVQPASSVASAASTNEIIFTTSTDWPITGKLQIVFPAGFDLTGVVAGSASSASDISGTLTASVSGQTLTLARAGGSLISANSVIDDLLITNIVNPSTVGVTDTFTVSTLTGAGVLIDTASAPGVPISAGAITGGAVTVAPTTASATSVATFTFTTSSAVPIAGFVEITFPAGFDVSAATLTSISPSLGANTFTISGDTVRIANTTGGTIGAQAFTVVLGGITNPSTVGLTPDFNIFTSNSSHSPVDAGTAPGITIAPVGGTFPYSSIYALAVFDGFLYAGVGIGTGADSTARIFRSADGDTWTQVNVNGFGDTNNIGIRTLVPWNSRLLAGTHNPVTGGELWMTTDGTTWTQINADGFGSVNNAMVRFHTVYQQVQPENAGGLYLSTANSVDGAQIFVDPLESTLSMTANKKQATIGEVVTYQIIIHNLAANDLQNAQIPVVLAPGFGLVSDSVFLDGERVADPSGSSTRTFDIGYVNVGQSRTLIYQVRVGAGVETGQKYKSTATATGTVLGVRANYREASWEVAVIDDPVFDEGAVIGKVFHDKNGNGVQDEGEVGIPKARLVTEEGIIITTDETGRYHLMGVLPKRHLIKIKTTSLSEGAFLTTPDQVLFETTRGLLSKVNFGVAYPEDNIGTPPADESALRTRFNSLFNNRVVEDAFFVNLTEGEIGAHSLGGNETIPGVNGASNNDSVRHDGRVAYFLDADLAKDFRLVSSLDTDRQQKRLFRNFDMRNYYPVYGDSSETDYSMTETQGNFYARLQRGPSYAMWGNYETGFVDSEILQYNRMLYGFKGRYQSEAQTKFSDPYHKTVLFSAKAKQLAAHDRFVASGASLYYLKNRNVIEGSERVKIVVESNASALPEQVTELSRDDYVIHYPEGRVALNFPLFSYAPPSSGIVSDGPLQGNPVYVVVDYEYESTDYFESSSFGASVTQRIGDHVSIGGVQVREGQSQDNYELRGVSSEFKLDESNKIVAEYGISQSESVSNHISDNGGLTFTQVSSAGNTRGDALNITAISALNEKLSGEAYYKNIASGFSQTSVIERRGTEKLGGAVSYNADSLTQIVLSHDVTTYAEGDLVTPQSVPGSRREATSSVLASRQWDSSTLATAEIRTKSLSDSVNPNETSNGADVNAPDSTDAAVQVEKIMNDRLKLTGRQQATIAGEANNQTSLGIDLKIDEKTDMGIMQTVGSKGNATQASLSRRINDRERIYLTAGSGPNTPSGIQIGEEGLINQSFTLGRSKQVDEKTTVSQETSMGKMVKDKIRDKIQANSSNLLSRLLTVDRVITENISVRVGIETADLNQNSGDILKNAFSLGITYVDRRLKNMFKIDSRKEGTAENSIRQTFMENELEYIWDKDLTLLSKVQFAQTSDQIASGLASFDEFSVGYAYRPLEHDRLNWLGRYIHLKDDPLTDQTIYLSTPNQSSSDVLSTDLIYDITDQLQLVEKLAVRFRSERVDPNPERRSTTALWVNRLNYNFHPDWGVAGEFRVLDQRETETFKGGFLFEIYRDIQDFARLSVGYNLTDFTDDLTDLDYSAQTFYFRVNLNMGSSQTRRLQSASASEIRRVPAVPATHPSGGIAAAKQQV